MAPSAVATRIFAQDEVDVTELADIADDIRLDQWIRAGIAIGITIAVIVGIRIAVRYVGARMDVDRHTTVIVNRLLSLVLFLVGLLVALAQLRVPIAPLLGVLGLAGFAAALALRPLLSNFFAAVSMQIRPPFRIGDQITTDDYSGTVRNLTWRFVVLETYAGEYVVIPNTSVLESPTENETRNGRRRTQLDVEVAYGTDLAYATETIEAALAGVDGIYELPALEANVTEFGESGINIAVWFWHAPDNTSVFRVRDAASKAIQAGFRDADITIPFPQRTLWVGER